MPSWNAAGHAHLRPGMCRGRQPTVGRLGTRETDPIPLLSAVLGTCFGDGGWSRGVETSRSREERCGPTPEENDSHSSRVLLVRAAVTPIVQLA